MTKKSIVLINGEKQVGKSTFAEHLANQLLENGISSSPYSFVAPIEASLRALMSKIHGTDFSAVPYDELKKAIVIPGLPFNGRDWMIQQGNAMRSLHPYALQMIFVKHWKQNPEVNCWIIENWGFPDELDFFREPATESLLGEFRLVTVHLSKRASRKYACGEQFDGDNRFNLDCRADHLDPRVNDIASIIDPGHPYPVDTIFAQFNTDRDIEPNPSEGELAEEETAA